MKNFNILSSHLDTLLTPSEPVGTINMKYSPSRPLLIPIKLVGRRSPPYNKIVIPDEKRHKPSFGGLPRGVPYDPVQLCHAALPDSLIEDIAESSNVYARQHLAPGKLQSDIKSAEILVFFAIYYYMGIVKLPAKKDYWRWSNDIWPSHPIAKQMRRDRFCYIWSNIHLVAFEEAEPESDEEEGDEDGVDELPDKDDPHGLASQDETEVWHHKAKPVLDHVESVSQKFCIHPGFCISIDKQMKKFKGRSAQTVRMKT